jgi:hypothetical protein
MSNQRFAFVGCQAPAGRKTRLFYKIKLLWQFILHTNA